MQLSSGRITRGTQMTVSQNSQSQRVGSLSAYGQTTHVKMLTEGEIIRGEVTDLRNSQVEVTLEDNTRVAAFLEDSASLSIGDTAAFRIVSLQNGTVHLKVLPAAQDKMISETIHKALSEAGLSADEKNCLLVRALMEQSMPINRASLSAMRKLTFQYPQIDPRSLILMQKNQLPVTPETVNFFQSFFKGKHPLFSSLEALTEEIRDLLLSSPADVRMERFLTLLSVFSPTDISRSESENPVFYFSSPSELDAALSLFSDISPFLNEEDGQKLYAELSNGAIHPAIAAPLLYEAQKRSFAFDYENLQKELPEPPLSEEMPKETSRLRSLLSSFFGNDTVSEKDRIPEEIAKFPEFSLEAGALLKEQLAKEKLPSTLDLFDHPLIERIFDEHRLLQTENHFLSTVLTKEQLQSLLKDLHTLPLSEPLKLRILTGSLSSGAFFSELSKAMKESFGIHHEELFQNPVFQKLFTAELKSSLFLTPKQLEEGKLREYYQSLEQKSNALAAVFSSQESGNNQPGHGLRQTLSLLKGFHDAFQYLEIPLRIREETHGADLFVYTRKQAVLENPEHIRILLHLTLKNIGATDVQISLENNQVHADFFLEEPHRALFQEHFEELRQTLMEKGFLLHASCREPRKKEALLKDFFEPDGSSTKKTRYTFDIRA